MKFPFPDLKMLVVQDCKKSNFEMQKILSFKISTISNPKIPGRLISNFDNFKNKNSTIKISNRKNPNTIISSTPLDLHNSNFRNNPKRKKYIHLLL